MIVLEGFIAAMLTAESATEQGGASVKTTAAASILAGSLAFVVTRAVRQARAHNDDAPVRFADAEESPFVRAARAVA